MELLTPLQRSPEPPMYPHIPQTMVVGISVVYARATEVTDDGPAGRRTGTGPAAFPNETEPTTNRERLRG